MFVFFVLVKSSVQKFFSSFSLFSVYIFFPYCCSLTEAMDQNTAYILPINLYCLLKNPYVMRDQDNMQGGQQLAKKTV